MSRWVHWGRCHPFADSSLDRLNLFCCEAKPSKGLAIVDGQATPAAAPSRMAGTHLDVTERRQQVTLLELIANCQRNLIAETDFAVAFESRLDGIITITESEYGFIGEILRQDNHLPYLKIHAITHILWDDAIARLYRENASVPPEGHPDLNVFFGLTDTG